MRIYCFRKNKAYKIFIDRFFSLESDGRLSLQSFKKLRKEIYRINKESRYYASEKIVAIRVGHFSYDLNGGNGDEK